MANTTGKKFGGRLKGTPNKVTQQVRDRIEREGDPIGFFLRVLNGTEKFKVVAHYAKTKSGKFVPVYVEQCPQPEQRVQAARFLGERLVPALKSIEFTDDDGTIKGAFSAALATMMGKK